MTNQTWVVVAGVTGLAGMASCVVSVGSGESVGAAFGGFANIGGDASPGGGDPAGGGSGNAAGSGAVLPPGAASGAACQISADCRPGLACQDLLCVPGHSLGEGDACVIGDECALGMQCVAGACAPAGTGMAADPCKTDADCISGLRCAPSGLALKCATEGTGDVGGMCMTSADCYAGLGCVSNVCGIVPPGGIMLPPPGAGVGCSPPETDTSRAYFEVPGAAGAQEGDFFRLPFPNDVRRVQGGLDLSGFPTLGAGILGFDPVQRYVDAVSANDTAWGADPTVTFRFSGPVDFKTLVQQNIHLSDITPGVQAPDDGFWSSVASSVRTSYICDNWFSMQRAHGFPLQPGRSYAFWLSTGIKTASGGEVQRSENLSSLLSDTAPADPKLAAAYLAYKPFRDFIAAGGARAPSSAAQVLNVAVITVGAIRDPMKALAAAVAAAPVPTTSSWVKCAAGVTSPCPQADGERACGAPNAAFDEYQALVSLPIFQHGFPDGEPYLNPSDGGEIKVSSPTPHEDVCLALTIPKGKTMPASGWPVAIFAHGTGGSFRSHVTENTAGVLAQASPAFAVLGIDQVEHGPRRGASTDSPNNLFFNFSNPNAARGNPLQGAADQLSLVRLAGAFDLSAAQTTGDAIKLDPAGIVFWGHSQGATEGSLAMPYADGVKAVVLSGNGAALKLALLHKTNPVNIAGVLPFILQDPSVGTGDSSAEMHPVLSLLQQWIDPADPLHFARVITRAPEAGHSAKNVFQPYGLGDTYAPPITLQEYAIAGGLALVAADSSAAHPDDIGGLTPVAAGVSGNVTVASVKYTLGVREYQPPSGDDGHFVAFDVPSANADVVRFLAAGVGATAPPIGQ